MFDDLAHTSYIIAIYRLFSGLVNDFGKDYCLRREGLRALDGDTPLSFSTVSNPKKRNGTAQVRFLVEAGAMYSVLPHKVSLRLGISALREAELVLADGTVIKRRIGEATFSIAGQRATSPVILGEEKDTALLGTVTLETLGLMLNSLTRELTPMKLILARLQVKT